MEKIKPYAIPALYLLAAVLFLAAFFINNISSMRYVMLFCAITFGALGVMYLRKMRGPA